MSSACLPTSGTWLITRQGCDHLSMARGGIYTADLAWEGQKKLFALTAVFIVFSAMSEDNFCP